MGSIELRIQERQGSGETEKTEEEIVI